MSAPLPVAAPAPRTFRRPFLTRRVLRGLTTLAEYGWAEIEDSPVPLQAATEGDALYAKRWVERMAAFRQAEKGARS